MIKKYHSNGWFNNHGYFILFIISTPLLERLPAGKSAKWFT